MNTTRALMALASLPLVLAACGDSSTAVDPLPEIPTLLTVSPQGGAVNVDPSGPITLTFDHPMGPAMEQFVALHEGDIHGPEVPGTWIFSQDRMVLRFHPGSALKPATTYTIHLGGGMVGEHGHQADIGTHGPGMGGEWATDDMMNETHGPGTGHGPDDGHGPGHGDGPGHGPGDHTDHMGPGWQHENGTYGMVFTFTTA